MTEYVTLSNTGKTITVSFSREFYDRWADVVPLDHKGRPHVDVAFDATTRIVTLTPGTTGRRVGKHTNGNGGAYVGCVSKVFPKWPEHGRLIFAPTLDETGVLTFDLPETGLPAPEPRKTSKNNAHASRTDYSHVGPIKSMPLQKPNWAKDPFEAPIPAEQVLVPDPKFDAVKAATSNILIELEGQPFTFYAPLHLRLKILSLLQADPNVKGDAPTGFD